MDKTPACTANTETGIIPSYLCTYPYWQKKAKL